MAHFSILFANEKTRNDFFKVSGEKIADATVKDLNIMAVLDEIRKLTPDFPVEYLLFPPYDIDTQNLRRETAEEIYGSSAVLDNMKLIATELYTLKQHRRSMVNVKNKDARNHCFLCSVAEYCAVLEHLASVTENARARGLASLHDYANAAICRSADIRARAKELLGRINEMLNVSLRFDFAEQSASIKGAEKGTASERLSLLAEDILGIRLDFAFSAVNNVQLSPLEEALLSLMKERNPAVFEELELFREENKLLDFDALTDLRSEILFFTGYIEFVKKYEKAGFAFSFAKITASEITAQGVYDISLAVKLGNPGLLVANGVDLKKGDIFVVSGSNQGGKTTFLRAFGQCIFFAAHGLPAPASCLGLPFFDMICTHFNRAENVGKSRLEDEVERVKAILAAATGSSAVLFNECFVGTRRGDAVILAEKVFERIFALGATCGFVTHFFELPLRDARLVSFMAEVADDGTERRTYRIVKRSPDGLAHAHSIAVACGATYEQLLAEAER